jgi:hypothetical protein
MARILEDHSWTRGKRRGSSYPWAEWFDGKTRELVRGEDFTSTLKSFRTTAYVAAKRAGVTVRSELRVTETRESIIIKAVG